MNFENLNSFKNLISKLEYGEISSADKFLAWNCYIYDKKNNIISGGTSIYKAVSLRIAYAELIERVMFKTIFLEEQKKRDFLIYDYPTTCGFAAGFSDIETCMRSICEAVERWSWTQWIDNACYVEPFFPAIKNELCTFLLSDFKNYQFYIKKINTEKMKELIGKTELFFCAILAYTEEGVFLGSRVSNNLSDMIQHSVIEAHRARKIFLKPSESKPDFYSNRVNFWGKNKCFIPKIENFKRTDFCAPELILNKKISIGDNLFFYRSICLNHKSWHIGDEKRFVY